MKLMIDRLTDVETDRVVFGSEIISCKIGL